MEHEEVRRPLRALDETTRTDEKVEALTRYFAPAPAGRRGLGGLLPDRPEAAAGRCPSSEAPRVGGRGGGRPRLALRGVVRRRRRRGRDDRPAPARRPSGRATCRCSHWVEERLLPLREAGRGRPARGDARRLGASWTGRQRFVWNKLISGGFRVGVSQQLVTRALAQGRRASTPAVVAHRLMGDWEPTPAFFDRLLAADAGDADLSRPYPFFLAHAARRARPRRSATDRRLAGRVEVGRHPLASSSAAAGRPSSGPAARSWSPSATPSSPPSAPPCPTGP